MRQKRTQKENWMKLGKQRRKWNFRLEPTEILELKTTTTELKHLQEGIKTRLYWAEKRISKPEDKSFEIIELRESNRKSEWKKGKDRLRDLLDTIKWVNIQIRENKNGKTENRQKAYLSKGQNLPKERNLTNSRRWKTSNSERPTLRNIIVELWKVTKI